MNLLPVEHFFEHICHPFWVGLLLHPPKSDYKYAQKSAQQVRGSSILKTKQSYFDLLK